MPTSFQSKLADRFSADVDIARNLFIEHPWLLVPDLQLNWLEQGFQGTYRNLDTGTGPPADFAIHFHLQGKLYIQFIRLASPSTPIINGLSRSDDFEAALQDVQTWKQTVENRQLPFQDLLPENGVVFMFRIVVGRSSQFSDEEKIEMKIAQEWDIRIRSYDWLIEKAAEYSTFMVEALDACGPPKSGEEFIVDLPELIERLNGPTPPYLSQ